MKRKLMMLAIMIVGLLLLGACSADEEEPPMELVYYDAEEETEYTDEYTGEETEPIAYEANQETSEEEERANGEDRRESNPTASGNIGFDTPEDAVVAYLEALRDGDLERMINAFAVEVYIENYDFEAMLNRIRAYAFHSVPNMRNVNPLIVELNIERRRAEIVNDIVLQLIFISRVIDETNIPSITPLEEGEADIFINMFSERLNAMDLQTIEVLGFIPPEVVEERYLSESNQDFIERWARGLGANQMASRVAIFELNGETYLLMLDVIEYDGRWYIGQLTGNIGILVGLTHINGGIVPVRYLRDSEREMLENYMIPR